MNEIVMLVYAIFYKYDEKTEIQIVDAPVSAEWLVQQHEMLKSWEGFDHIEVRTVERPKGK